MSGTFGLEGAFGNFRNQMDATLVCLEVGSFIRLQEDVVSLNFEVVTSKYNIQAVV